MAAGEKEDPLALSQADVGVEKQGGLPARRRDAVSSESELKQQRTARKDFQEPKVNRRWEVSTPALHLLGRFAFPGVTGFTGTSDTAP